MTTARVEIPAKLLPVFGPARGSVRYRALHGGRGSGKSRSAATIAAIWGYTEKLRILCARELQVSIKESFHAELKAAIEAHPWLAAHYDVGVDYLRGKNGTEFIFRGLRHNAPSIKSLSGIDLTIVEEAEDVPEESWLALEATVFRQPSSELWALWNPRRKGSPVDNRFRQNPPENALIAQINWRDNEFFPEGLDELRQREKERLDPGVYEHVWEGAYAAAAEGAYYARDLAEARREGRIGLAPRDPLMEVRAYWDIGGTGARADATAIWLVQFVGPELRWLDYYEASGQPLASHVEWLRSRGYPIRTCVLPHDGANHEKVYAVSYESSLREAGFEVQVIPNQGRGAASKRIEALRRLFPSCRFNEATTQAGLDALGWYHEKRDEARGVGLGPEHDWSSHCADAAGLVAVAHSQHGPSVKLPKFTPRAVL